MSSVVRLQDIADLAGVDKGTVSHVLNRRPKSFLLRAETRERIERVASELGYCRNELAASISSRHSRVLAFVTSDMGIIDYTGRVQNGVFDAACELDYTVSLHHLNADNAEAVLQKILGWRCAGVIFHVSELESPALLSIITRLSELGTPYGFVNQSHSEALAITTDDRTGIIEAMRHLRQAGSKYPAFVSELRSSHKTAAAYIRCREEAYFEGMQDNFARAEPLILRCSGSLQGTADHAQYERLLDEAQASGVDALLCISDLVAFKLLQSALLRGLKVPQQLRLVGFGDLNIGRVCRPALSTIAQDFESMGRQMCETIVAKIEKKYKGKNNNKQIPVKLILRESSPA